ncbi:embryonic protein UVS.2-like isoform X1 [Xenopus laevis]|uniref:Metalloendopeptidase n=1 Tax=Xenopus laevis TaxID=8355 RepID=A0A8J1KJF4_XENLA|nr:embryonic protein UVS.2-like isoform X1 [Xenopus laevis]
MAFAELQEMKRTLASLKLLEGQKEEGSSDPLDILSEILQANEGANMPIEYGDIFQKLGRSATNCTKCLWPKSSSGLVNVPYTISPVFSDSEKTLIRGALNEIMTLSCIRFKERTTQADFLRFQSGNGCWSSVGKTGGSQDVSVSKNGCMSHGIIQHESLHALGFIHEHSRSDRDNYVDIIYKYINDVNRASFDKENSNNLGFQYDYSSVMHYGRFSFTNTTGQATIKPKPDPTVFIGQRYGISRLDVSKLNRLYECNICSNLLTEPNGTFTSANYPSAYPPNSDCIWLIRLPADKVFLQFNAFDVQSSSKCASDYLKVYDGDSRSSPVLLDRACGTGKLPPLVSSGNTILVEFVSDASGLGMGFKASYSTVTGGGSYLTDNGVITSPGYPSNYPNSMDCIYNIVAPTGYKISLAFTSFQTEFASNCMAGYDYLAVYDGSSLTSPLLRKLCGSPENIPQVVSTGNNLLLQFISDIFMNYPGFHATYSFGKDEGGGWLML